ncbi:MAG: aminopeptidase [bacterium]
MQTSYTPSKNILEKYANVLVNFALNNGKGIKKGDTVLVQGSESCRPFYLELLKAVWRAGGNAIPRYAHDTYSADDNTMKFFYENATKEQLEHFPKHYNRGLVDEVDHSIFIISETNKKALQGVDPAKMMARGKVMKPAMDWRREKENAGKYTWTLALYGTPAMAKEAKMTEKEYWNQIIKACFLDEKDPVKKWKEVYKQMAILEKKLNKLPIDKLHVFGQDVDLWISLGEKRKWVGGAGRNIPSFELFTSPDWRGTNGTIRFNQPLYRYGNLIEGVELEFENGKVIKSTAKKNEKVLKEMVATEHADKVGEFSLTDKRFSRITRFMAETLFDENMGGPEGNTHIALGASYHDCFDGDPSQIQKEEWERLGFNDSSVHTDIVSTTPRTVTAYLHNGKKKIIYKDGQFML